MQKITIYSEHLNFGGIERYIYLFTKMFINEYDIDIIVNNKYSDIAAFEFDKRVNIVYLTDDYYDKISLKKLIRDKEYLNAIKEIIRRKKHLRNIKRGQINHIKNLQTDYIITTRTPHNELISKYYKGNAIKIATEHNYHNNDEEYINNFISSVRNFDYVVHCTKELYDFYKDKIVGPKNILISNSIELTNQKTSKLNNLNIISAGRLSPEKGYEDLINTMKIIHESNDKIKLSICGDGYLRSEIEKQIEDLNLQDVITIKGFLSHDKLEKEYEKASLYVLPSKSEAFGLVLLEAMSHGLPCIAFDTASGARNLLSNNKGILIKNRNIELMAKEILDTISSPEKLKEYQKKSLENVKKYDINIIKKDWKKQIFKDK